ncbi:Lipopolysaccharide-induced TNF factor [Aphelenchoides bicaudatus]|nr:Lipopolysaccharide-induced TNF factor [Aphelenchoides bicaudatus]
MSSNPPPSYNETNKPDGYPQQNMSGGAAPYPSQAPPQPVFVQPQPQPFVYVSDPAYGPRPVSVTCPQCHQNVITHVRYSPGLLAWLICAGCVIFGCIFGCCLIPFCVDDCQDCEHQCPNCHAFLGQYKRI